MSGGFTPVYRWGGFTSNGFILIRCNRPHTHVTQSVATAADRLSRLTTLNHVLRLLRAQQDSVPLCRPKNLQKGVTVET